MARDPPSESEWRTFYARLCRLITLYRDSTVIRGVWIMRLEIIFSGIISSGIISFLKL